MAAFDVDIPEFSGFDLKLHAIAAAEFRLRRAQVRGAEGLVSVIARSGVSFFRPGNAVCNYRSAQFGIAVSDGQIRITTATPGAGEFQYQEGRWHCQKMLGVADLTLLLENGRLDFTATIEPFTSSYARDDVTIDKSWLPLLLHVEKLAVTTGDRRHRSCECKVACSENQLPVRRSQNRIAHRA